jgi:hypothetical protein
MESLSRHSSGALALISIGGMPRSGTTLLGAMLGNRDDAFYVGEIQARFRPTRRHHFDIEPVCGERPCPKWERLRDVSAKDFHIAVCQRLGVRFVVDSSKNPAWILDSRRWARRSGLRVHNVLIWKEPKDLAYSHWKRGAEPLRWRDRYVSYHRLLLAAVPSIVTVNYRSLSEDPRAVLAELGSRVGMPYQAGQEEFWSREQHFLFGSDSIQIQATGGSGAIKPTRIDPAFEEAWAALEPGVRSDRPLQEVVETLSAWVPRRGSTVRVVPPLWYLRSRFVSAVRRHFPASWRPSRFREGIERVPR